jgi:predicted secreted protein
VTYFVAATPALAGRMLEIWTRTRAGAWTEATSRTVAADGTMRYVTRITAWTAFQARYAGDDTTATSASHGRIATVTARGDGLIAIGCGEFEQWTTSDGRAVLRRTASVRASAVLRVTLCSNASTGYRWDAPRTSARYLALLGHRVLAPTSGLIGAAGSEAWTFRALRSATTSLTLTYRRPWQGGEQATWSVVLAVRIVG